MEEFRNNRQPQPSTSSKSGSKTAAPETKRSRVVVSQSKRGCVTCKTRRVKCDEQKPLCRRCVQAGRLCGGYSHESQLSGALQPALKIGIRTDNHTERLSYLAAQVLSLDNDGRPLQQDCVWGRIFVQLSNQVECVKAAAAAFGAAYESSLNNAIAKGSSSAWRYYGSALTTLQSDLNSKAAGRESLALASMILACVEILSQHERNALTHFLGAVQILTQTYQSCHGVPPTDILDKINDELVRINLLIGSYALSQTPSAMFLDFQEIDIGNDAFREPELAINTAMLCLHRSYQFIESAARLRYTYPSWKEQDPVMCKGQSDAVTECRSVLDGLTAVATRLQARYSGAASTRRESEELAEIYAIRAQLRSTIIFLLCAHSPFQTAYDEHLDEFRAVVSDAAASARLMRRAKPGVYKRFSTRPGIVGPLFIVSMKCRDTPLRALATTMLNEQGREGPTDGRIMAAIGARLASLETSACNTSSPCTTLAACDVLEGQRVHGYGVSPPRVDGDGRSVVDVRFSRPKVPLLLGWGQVDYSCLDNWTFWSEAIDI